jgi:hypothetical protein
MAAMGMIGCGNNLNEFGIVRQTTIHIAKHRLGRNQLAIGIKPDIAAVFDILRNRRGV